MSEYIDMIAQGFIFVCGVGGLWLVNCVRPRTRRWGPVLGLLGQPAWFATTIINGQWFIAGLCIFYTAAWARGFWSHWLQKGDTPDEQP